MVGVKKMTATSRRTEPVERGAAKRRDSGGEAGPVRRSASHNFQEQTRSLTQADYGRRLRLQLTRREVNEVVKEATKEVWPNLNRVPFRLGSPTEFARQWSNLGIKVRLANLSGPEGLGLVGFYVKKIKGVIEHPMICVNIAHHPTLVGTAFAHEMGHHLTARMFGARTDESHLLLRSDFELHLDEPKELVADILVSLGIYPAEKALRMFGNSDPQLSSDLKEMLCDPAYMRAFDYIADIYGLRIDGTRAGPQKVHCMAALAHYTKLRRALVDEYGI